MKLLCIVLLFSLMGCASHFELRQCSEDVAERDLAIEQCMDYVEEARVLNETIWGALLELDNEYRQCLLKKRWM